jgi:excisionase family DNA binding protein
MAQLRAVWPDVERALSVGHTLRVIHRRLNQMGIPITYRRLTVYRGRLQREKEKSGRSLYSGQPIMTPTSSGTGSDSGPASQAFDPLSNFREQEKKRVVWQYPSGPPDESKLIWRKEQGTHMSSFLASQPLGAATLSNPVRDELPLTVRAAASFLGVSPQTVYLWVERKQIPHLRVMGRNIRFLKSDLEPFRATFKQEVGFGKTE